jgi:hypothetical protein
LFILVNFGMKYEKMEFGICLMPVVPLRREPNDRSEMLTQMLFGETARIFERKQKWFSVETDLDNYPGWIDAGQLTMLDAKEYERITGAPVLLTDQIFSSLEDSDGNTLHLPLGSCLPGLEDNRLVAGEWKFRYEGTARKFGTGKPDEVIGTAKLFLNAPYLWGGKTHMGIDCSGLTQLAFRRNGMNIPRDARQQASVGEQVGFLSEARAGDLAFFDNPEGVIVHVGIILDHQSILHASGKVKIDALDHNGIFNSSTRSYSHQLRIIRRILQ